MSHIVTIKTEIRDAISIGTACERLGLPPPRHGTFELFTSKQTGLAVQLPGWNYPVVCQTETGQVHYDNYGGRWGEHVQLDRFLQSYAVSMATLEARKQGRSVREQTLADGSIRLTIELGGAA